MRLRASHAVTATLAAVLLALAVAVAQASVSPPRSGATYKGRTARGGPVSLQISGRSILLVTFQFPCKGTVKGNSSLQDVRLKKGRTGWRFAITAFAGVTYSDDKDPDNAKITIAGTFNRTGRRVTGTLRARSPRCGDSGTTSWRAKR